MSKLSKALQAAAGNSAPQITKLYVSGEASYGQLNNSVNSVGNSAPVTDNEQTTYYGPWNTWSRTVSDNAGIYFLVRSDGTLWVYGKNVPQAGVNTAGNGSKNFWGLLRVGQSTDWLDSEIWVCWGGSFVIAKKGNGTLWAWGSNTYGQLGQNNVIATSSPVQIGSDTDWSTVAGSDTAWVGIKTNGTMWSCGRNNVGQLGQNNVVLLSSPTQIGALTNWVSIGAGDQHFMAVNSDGRLYTWGNNGNGQLGDGTLVNKSSPVQIGSLTTWNKTYGGNGFSASIKTDGTLWTWGSNAYGQLGHNNGTYRSSPVQVGSRTNWTDICIAGSSFMVGIRAGDAYGWGRGNSLLPTAATNNQNQSSPIQIGTDINAVVHSVIPADIFIGKNNYQPQSLLLFRFDNFTRPRSRGYAVAGFKFPTNNVTEPIQVDTTQSWIDASDAMFGVCAIRSDGTLWSWGYNVDGQLGNNTVLPKSSPTQVGSDTNWAKVSGNLLLPTNEVVPHFVATKTDGTLWSWGDNTNGKLGDYTRTNRSSPVQVGSDATWVDAKAGRGSSIGLKSDGTIWTWGVNNNGQLGLNLSSSTSSSRSSPIQVGSLTTWSSISLGWLSCYAIKTDGTLWAWGSNVYGQLGDNTISNKSSPVQIGSLTNWSKVSGDGQGHTLAIKTDGTLWSWGYNNNGQLGDPSAPNSRSSPVQVGSDTNWIDVFGYSETSYALKSDGTLYTFGAALVSQSNVGVASGISFESSSFNRSSPVQIGTDATWLKIKGACFITNG